jgi:hypothetical protein
LKGRRSSSVNIRLSMPLDHSIAIEAMGGRLATAPRASWLPKITNGWFFRAAGFVGAAVGE